MSKILVPQPKKLVAGFGMPKIKTYVVVAVGYDPKQWSVARRLTHVKAMAELYKDIPVRGKTIDGMVIHGETILDAEQRIQIMPGCWIFSKEVEYEAEGPQ